MHINNQSVRINKPVAPFYFPGPSCRDHICFWIGIDGTRVIPVFVQMKLHHRSSSFSERDWADALSTVAAPKLRAMQRHFASSAQRMSISLWLLPISPNRLLSCEHFQIPQLTPAVWSKWWSISAIATLSRKNSLQHVMQTIGPENVCFVWPAKKNVLIHKHISQWTTHPHRQQCTLTQFSFPSIWRRLGMNILFFSFFLRFMGWEHSWRQVRENAWGSKLGQNEARQEVDSATQFFPTHIREILLAHRHSY